MTEKKRKTGWMVYLYTDSCEFLYSDVVAVVYAIDQPKAIFEAQIMVDKGELPSKGGQTYCVKEIDPKTFKEIQTLKTFFGTMQNCLSSKRPMKMPELPFVFK